VADNSRIGVVPYTISKTIFCDTVRTTMRHVFGAALATVFTVVFDTMMREL